METFAIGGSGWQASWSPGIGPRLGLAAIPFYVLAAWQCTRLARGKGVVLADREAACWWILGGMLLSLGVYKLLDLQTGLAELGRIVATEQDWYGRRRPVQRAVVLAVILASVAGAAVALWLVRQAPPPTRVAAAAGIGLAGFVAMRTISFHDVDRFLDSGFAGLKINWAIELGGIFIILGSIRWRMVRRSNKH